MITYSRNKWMALVALSALSVVLFSQSEGAASKSKISTETFKVKPGGNVVVRSVDTYKKACILVPNWSPKRGGLPWEGTGNYLDAKVQVQLQRKLPNRPFALNSGFSGIGPWITVVRGTPYWYKTIPTDGNIYLAFKNKDCLCDVEICLTCDPN